MNERIKELWLDGAQSLWPRPGKCTAGEYDYNLEKFAELIVRECADLAKKKAFVIMQKAEEYAADKEEMITATSAAFQVEILGQEIQKHFGVEE